MPGFYHLRIKIGSRSTGRSAVAAAAYRSGTKIEDQETGIVADYTKKGGVAYSEIVLPEGAPSEYADRSNLWNAVEKVEKQGNAQLFREFEIAFPKELTPDQRIGAAREFAKHRAAEGMIVDFSIHVPDKGAENPHCHMMCTTRGVMPDGSWAPKEKKDYVYERDNQGNRIPEIDPETGKQKVKIIRGEEQLQWKKVPEIDPKTGEQKVRIRKGKGVEKIWKRETTEVNDWNRQTKAEEWRKDWADVCNKYLERENQIDHRSYKRQGIDRIPTIHEGYAARAIEERGGIAERCEINREIKKSNVLIENLKAEIQSRIKGLTEWIRETADELRNRIKKLQENIEGSRENDGRTAKTGRGYGATTARDRSTEEYHREIKQREQTAAGISAEMQRGVKESERRESEFARSESEIADVLEKISVIRKERDDRIRKLMEKRRGFSQSAGTAADRDRRPEQPDTDAIIREAEAGIRSADAAEKNSAAERAARDAERERQAAAERERADVERRKAEKARRRRKERSRDDERDL